ncbi:MULTISPECIES: HIT domain-containing protein [unclassified Salinicola]|uniref:HIT domain-containing protein n=1 Tax=unclassified Salinicola TaxID=2634022 RepID=UPI001A8FABC8|nr:MULTISPECIES: HIT domain-containing protein [unclassified Salinicola]MCE3028517.1 HIT domain-containing protein [Salinicola sp. DM10]WIX33382.1 HIT domain-containing protein [Salinicola sp. JS01]
MPTFTLDPRLEQDSLHVIDLTLCQLRLSRDARYPWAILIPRRSEVVELYHLDSEAQAQLWHEGTRLGEAMMGHYGGDKLNVATLGNMVPQLHLHVIVRTRGDDAWPGPVWGQGEPRAYTEAALESRRNELEQLALGAGLLD